MQRKIEKQESELRNRRKGADGDSVEGGSKSADAWRECLHKDSDTKIQSHGVENIGGRGRRIFACRLSMPSGVASELGQLAYPRIFKEQTEAETAAEERGFLICYYATACFLALFVIMWLTFVMTGLKR